MAAEEYDNSPTLENLVLQDTLKWIFVGGKGGVGKTTTSCCLGAQLAASRDSVLIVSTDPAHNLSDAFNQKFGKEPTLVNGFTNLYCMEIEAGAPDIASSALGMDAGEASGLQSMFQDIAKSIPGIDEAMGFAEMMKHVQKMEYSCIVFDTAPTGHTLRMLSFPKLMTGALDKLTGSDSPLGGLFNQAMSMFGGRDQGMLSKMNDMQRLVNQVSAQFCDPELTTFVCVCIPEFLSLYETERLIQELMKSRIDSHNIVVNQVLFPTDDTCKKCRARTKMQQKYLDQIRDLYEDFHVVITPLLNSEVRGVARIRHFSKFLVDKYDPSVHGDGELS